MAPVEYLAVIETNKPVQQATAGLVECDVLVFVQMLIPLIRQKTVDAPQAQYIDKFVDVFPASQSAEYSGSATGSIS